MGMSPSEAAAKGLGWVPDDHPLYGTKGYAGYQDPASDYTNTSAVPAAAAPLPPPSDAASALPPDRAATPALGPLTVQPPPREVGPLMDAPPRGQREAAPNLGPLVDHNGTATHDPSVPMTPTDPSAPPNPADPLNTKFRDALLRLLDTSDPSMSDPALKAQSDAFAYQQQRAKESARNVLAERHAGQGGVGVDSGAFDTELTGMEERQGAAQGANDAGLLAHELEARRSQLLSAAALAGNTLNQEQQLALSSKIADVDAQLRRATLDQQGGQFDKGLSEQQRQFDIESALKRHGIDVSAGQFDRSLLEQGREADLDAEMKRRGIDLQGEMGRGDLDLRRYLGEGNLNLGLLSALFQNSQFGQGLGAQLGMFNSSQNNNFLQALLAALGRAG